MPVVKTVLDLPPRLQRDVHALPETGCWVLDRSPAHGKYVLLRDDDGRMRTAHRWSFEALVGPIPEGLTLDHVRRRGCSSKACINPAHLEAVTSRENTLRSDGPAARQARQTACGKGHPFDDANTYTRGRRRYCRECRRNRNRGEA